MTRFAIDPPTLVELARTGRSIAAMHQLVAPNSLRMSAMSLLLEHVRSGEMTEDDALRVHERMTEIRVRLLGDRVSRRTAWSLARTYGWNTLCDAEYLAVAKLQADAIIASEPGLAAKAGPIVRLARLRELDGE